MKCFVWLLLLIGSAFGQLYPLVPPAPLSAIPTYTRVNGGAVGNNIGAAATLTCASTGGTGGCTSNVTTGNLLVVGSVAAATTTIATTVGTATISSWTKVCPTSAAYCTGSSVTDTNGCVDDISGASIGFACMWYATVTSGGTATIVVTAGSGTATNIWGIEFHRTTGTWALDVSATSNGNSAFNTAMTVTSGSVAGAGELNIASGEDAGGTSISYTPTGALTTKDAATRVYDQQMMYNLSAASGTQAYSATLSASSNWMIMGVSFK
jgi:hypothetical protein